MLSSFNLNSFIVDSFWFFGHLGFVARPLVWFLYWLPPLLYIGVAAANFPAWAVACLLIFNELGCFEGSLFSFFIMKTLQSFVDVAWAVFFWADGYKIDLVPRTESLGASRFFCFLDLQSGEGIMPFETTQLAEGMLSMTCGSWFGMHMTQSLVADCLSFCYCY